MFYCCVLLYDVCHVCHVSTANYAVLTHYRVSNACCVAVRQTVKSAYFETLTLYVYAQLPLLPLVLQLPLPLLQAHLPVRTFRCTTCLPLCFSAKLQTSFTHVISVASSLNCQRCGTITRTVSQSAQLFRGMGTSFTCVLRLRVLLHSCCCRGRFSSCCRSVFWIIRWYIPSSLLRNACSANKYSICRKHFHSRLTTSARMI